MQGTASGPSPNPVAAGAAVGGATAAVDATAGGPGTGFPFNPLNHVGVPGGTPGINDVLWSVL